MTVLKVDPNEAYEAANLGRRTADTLRGYAEVLGTSVGGPLQSLTGGSTGNVMNAVYAVEGKQVALRGEAERYDEAADRLALFGRRAADTDRKVCTRMNDLRTSMPSMRQRFQAR